MALFLLILWQHDYCQRSSSSSNPCLLVVRLFKGQLSASNAVVLFFAQCVGTMAGFQVPCSVAWWRCGRALDLRLASRGSIPGRSASTQHRSTHPRIPPGSLNRVSASAGGKGGILTSVQWHVALCDPIWHVSFP